MGRAADLWAAVRNAGLPTADEKELDVDVIQAAQLLTAAIDPADLVIATSQRGPSLSICSRGDLGQDLKLKLL